jgi:hypothetical protein
MKRRTTAAIIIEPTGPPLPRGGRHTAKVRQALANYDAMMADADAPTITPEYRRAVSALDYILKVLSPAELTAYYHAVRQRRSR